MQGSNTCSSCIPGRFCRGLQIETNIILEGEALRSLKERVPDGSVDCVVTSPPYWALRDYGVEGQLGQERTPEEYVRRLCDVFDELRRVLKPTGTCWVNLGDTYASGKANRNAGFNARWHGAAGRSDKQAATDTQKPTRPRAGLPEKSLCLIPFRFAIAMLERGWILRNVIIWHKPNALPSSVIDRFSVDFEYLFFFAKAKRYWFAPQYEPHQECTRRRVERFVRNRERFDPRRHKSHTHSFPNPFDVLEHIASRGLNPLGRHKRCVWSIGTQPFPEPHFATFPERLCEIPIRTGCPELVCTECGRPNAMEVRKTAPSSQESWNAPVIASSPSRHRRGSDRSILASCGCGSPFEAGIVLDPFFGAGTTGLVAMKLGRRFIGIELNPEYVQMAEKRIAQWMSSRPATVDAGNATD